ncbi:MAG: ParB N-terminal domain-containing protein [Oscillospiraceae bacterium]|nr:ParB N-terminal domain-containing protein [Oscillospiraceae bacterium]
MEIRKMKIADLHRAAYNPRVDLQPGDEEYETIKKSVSTYGLVQPIVWNERSGTVISGHQRLTVLEDMGETEADVSVVDLSDIQEKQLNIAMNKVTGEWDDRKLSDILTELGDEAPDTGFTLPEIDVLKNELESFFDDQPDEPEQPETGIEDTFLITLSFYKDDEKDLKAYIKKHGEDGIVQAIVDHLKGENQ